MLRRKATTITLTMADVLALDDERQQQASSGQNLFSPKRSSDVPESSSSPFSSQSYHSSQARHPVPRSTRTYQQSS
ncbi:hypothetical protein V1514DRAFT_353201 [Lipomyces japonicus]|uniref:uncharacterized protein n=1 Tax=Lipomyces japonicus TaxID=56871 RepID=UPI0034CDD799